MTLGRPTMTQQHNLPPPKPLWEDDFVSYELDGTQQKLSLLSSYVETIKLYQILAKVVTDVYKPWSAYSIHDSSRKSISEKDNEMQTVMLLADELTEYSESIETILHWRNGYASREQLPNIAQAAIQRQSNVLHAR